jgi:hypothetical protein
MVTVEHTRWGPFVPSIPYPELLRRLGILRAFVLVYVRPDEPIHWTLWRAEHGETDLVDVARVEFDALPALAIRNILGSYAKHWRGPGKSGRKEAADAADAGD